MTASVAVLRFPGSNCEGESLRAVLRAGLRGRIVRWNEPAEELARHDAYILPGGFSYQDRIRAGAVAARLPLLEVLSSRAKAGAPVLGICNGAQILVEAGLVPGSAGVPEGVHEEPGRRPVDPTAEPASKAADPVRLALAPNRITGRDGYYTRWVFLAPGAGAGACLFTRDLQEPVPMPMAHGEGRFVTADSGLREGLPSRIALRYGGPGGEPAAGFPRNPNGSLLDAAGVAGGGGNILALMPHPERAQLLAQVPEYLPGTWGERRRAAAGAAERLETDGPGMLFFRALARALTGRPRRKEAVG